MVYLSMQDQMNTEGLLLLDIVPCDDTSNHYCHTLQKLCNKIENKYYGKCNEGIILLHNNACSHVPDRV